MICIKCNKEYLRGNGSYKNLCRSCYWKEYYQKNKEWDLNRRKKYYHKHKQERLDYQKKWNKENYDRDRIKKINRKWIKNHPLKVRWIWQQEHFRRKNAIGKFTLEEWNNLKKEYNFTCLMCKKQEPEIKLFPDHIVPLIKNGTNFIENIQPLCKSCNSKKGIKIMNLRKKEMATPNS